MIKPPAKPAETAARIVHDLGLAACFGGTHFGKVIFDPSLSAIGSKTERGRLGAAFWNRSNPINAAAFGVAAATWLPGRLGLSGGGTGQGSRSLVLTKDVLMGAAASAGLAAVAAQISLNRQAPAGAVPLESGGVPAPEAGTTTALIQRAVGALGGVNVTLFGASSRQRSSSLMRRMVPRTRVPSPTGRRGRRMRGQRDVALASVRPRGRMR